ncbi:unnamed protein product [Bursaphelenchus okinawaensis]|uniref:BTB domain-containing protein n=1 Tax=Bursaphelenchus okinawaensis TaxID=465554 RepID=A0A811LQV6_9BILA|nr:unnamed protein product [Bursaphelenchus okinawaensis]CAG9126877.1 unnamed protein product [Bursaphelenchus okinawaensis]
MNRHYFDHYRVMELLSLKDCPEQHSSTDSMESINEEVPPTTPTFAPMLKRLNEFRMMAIGCDVTFLVGEKRRPIFSHKLILACSSQVFKAMFYGLLSEFPHSFPTPEVTPPVDDHSDSSSLSSSFSSSNFSQTPEDESEDEAKVNVEVSPSQTNDVLPSPNKLLPPTQTRYVATEMSMFTDRRYVSPVETVEVPDINPSAFRKMIEFIYSDFDPKSVHLTDNNVMEVLYAAKKYAIDALVDECVRYLLNDLSPFNAVFLLSQARVFNEETLIKRCYEVIDRNTDVALQAEHIEDVDKDTLMTVLRRTQLDPSSELIIFNAARGWAEADCKRQKLEPTPQNIRQVLGPALSLIRYPRMEVTEFGQVAMSGILTCEEMAEVFMHLTVKPAPFCRYSTGFRCSSRSKHVVQRFGAVSSKRCSKRESKVAFTVDRDVQIHGLGIYGMNPIKPHTEEENTWRCQVEIQLGVVTDPSSYASTLGVLASNNVYMQGFLGEEQPVVASFKEPVPISPYQSYVATVRFISETAIQTISGKDGKEAVTVTLPNDETVTFKFNSYRNSYGDDGYKSEGQIPSLHFYVAWPEKETTTMSTAFKASVAASAAQSQLRPSVFDILSQQSQQQSLKPAIQYILKFGALFYQSKNINSLMKWFDEIYAVVMLTMENHSLKKYGASFSENFYSMKRVFDQHNSLPTDSERRKSLLFLVIVPYIESKLSAYKNKIENTDPNQRTPFMNMFFKIYPVFQKILGIIGLIFVVLYGFGYVDVQNLPLLLLGARLHRLTPEEMESFEKPVYNESGVLGRVTRVFLQIPSWTGRFFSYALFFKDVHEFVTNNDEDHKGFKYDIDFARPVHPTNLISPSELAQMETDKCPLCHNRRQNDTVLSVSGYVFCFTCINSYVRLEKRCPITNLPASHEQLVRLYRKSG